MSGITGAGVNAQRSIMEPLVNRDDVYADQVANLVPRGWSRAVVVDVLFDPEAIGDETRARLRESLGNEDLLDRAPRNSIVARIVSGAEDRRRNPNNEDQPKADLFFPMLSHLNLPLKPGEHVWVMFEDPDGTNEQGFWLSRIVEPLDIDDPNLTVADRKFGDDRDPTTIEKSKTGGTVLTAPNFPNGGNTEDSFTLASADGYEKIDAAALANRVITHEPVPRYKKRPSDWVAEGSNNSLLVLGEDRTGPATDIGPDGDVKGKPQADKQTSAGMFDLVVGRGRKLPAAGAAPEKNAPAVVTNSRGFDETDKTVPSKNIKEGDPNFDEDAARIYGTMDTNLDNNFKLHGNLPELTVGTAPETITAGAAVIAKSDHCRVIAREDGTIRIFKEGPEATRAVIIIEKDGTIMIDGPKMIIGSGNEKANGAGDQLFLGRDATEPIVLGDQLKALLETYVDGIKQQIDAFEGVVGPLATAGNLGNFGLPVAGIIAIGSAATALKTGVGSVTSALKGDGTSTGLSKILSKNGKTK